MQVSAEVRKDMLSESSTVQEMLRALYFYGADYIMLVQGKMERLIHKDQLVALLEGGREEETLAQMATAELREPLRAKMQMESIPPASSLLLFEDGELSGTTFEAYRQWKIERETLLLPEWWNVPLPVVYVDDERVLLNDSAQELIPGGAKAVSKELERLRTEGMIVVREKKRDRTFSLSLLAENTYFVEDISGDFEMAEDLVWWAAIGKAFLRRMEENGLVVRRLSPYEAVPDDVVETIPCAWEGELMGRLAIYLPADAGEAAIEQPEPPIEREEPVSVSPLAAVAETFDDLSPASQPAGEEMPSTPPTDDAATVDDGNTPETIEERAPAKSKKAAKKTESPRPEKTIFDEPEPAAPKKSSSKSSAKRRVEAEPAVDAIAALNINPLELDERPKVRTMQTAESVKRAYGGAPSPRGGGKKKTEKPIAEEPQAATATAETEAVVVPPVPEPTPPSSEEGHVPQKERVSRPRRPKGEEKAATAKKGQNDAARSGRTSKR